jgi:chromate transporter
MEDPNALDIFVVFTKIGALSFGGPYAILAYVEREVVREREWIDADEFAKAVGIGTLTPGPIAYSAAVYVGYRLRGMSGAAAAAFGLTWPSFVLALGIAVAYGRFASLPSIQPILRGFEAAIIGLLLAILWRMAKPLGRNLWALALAAAAFAALVLRVNPAIVIIASGAIGFLLGDRLKKSEASDS